MNRNQHARTCAQISVVLAVTLMLAGMAAAQVTGAAFTSEPVKSVPCSPSTCVPDLTDNPGTFVVNANLYPAKPDVFLNGGPKNDNHAGLTPSGTAGSPFLYYFQVTDPNGSVLLSADPAACRIVDVVTDSSGHGRVDGLDASVLANPSCPTRVVIADPASGDTANPVQMCPPASGRADTLGNGAPLFDTNNWCDNTPNPGGEYKAFLIRADKATVDKDGIHLKFSNSDSQTDNFKIKQTNVAYVEVCKFNDDGEGGGTIGNGIQDGTEPLIPHWPINATGVDTGSGIGTVNTQTSDDGCVQPPFSISTFAGGTATVTLTETQQNGWTQTAALDGLYDSSGTPGCSTNCPTSVAGFVDTITISPGDFITAPNFGNFQPGEQTQPLVVTKTASPSFTRTFTWNVSKSVDNTTVYSAGGGESGKATYTVSVTHDSGTDSGWQDSGTITIANPNSSDVSGVTVQDGDDAGGTCTVDSSNFNGTVPKNSHVDLPYTCTYAAQPPSNTTFTNTATALWDSTSASGTATFDFSTASINIVDGSVTVTDTLDGTTSTLGTVSYTDPSPTTFQFSETFTDKAGTCTTHKNTASVQTNTSNTTTTSNEVDVQDCQGADLTVSKTATAAYNSNITKSVDKTTVEISGGTATFNYTVKVTTSGWTVSGNITVTNPNNWESITANLSDSLSDSGGSCSITGGSSQVVGANGSISPAYTCTFAAVPGSSSGTNTAKATWDGASAHTPNSSATGTANYTFSSLTVTDCFGIPGTTCPPATPKSLGSVTIPPGSATFTYSRSVPAPTGGSCQEYDNTATIVETGQNASQKVEVCNTKTGALTMGFWQNKNGQGIISGGGSTGGVCNSGTFLRTYAPFQDLSATATCSQVATYVYNIIKAANAGGATMNAMLKAQMLATALDVFFSDPALGGNKIGAAQPLGGVKIDLTQVCIMIDSSGGSASCSGKTENCVGAFGGSPTCQTVLQLLAYAASQSNAGGTAWYGQNKTTQGLAKNTFDAINNQAAYICP